MILSDFFYGHQIRRGVSLHITSGLNYAKFILSSIPSHVPENTASMVFVAVLQEKKSSETILNDGQF